MNHKFNKDRVSNPKSQESDGNGSSTPACQRRDKIHLGKCLAGTDGCFSCGKSGHKMKYFPTLATKGMNGRKSQPSGLVLMLLVGIYFMLFRLDRIMRVL